MTLLALTLVFSLVPHTAHAQTYALLHTFSGGADGALPVSGLTMDHAGNFYGTTASGANTSTICIQDAWSGCGGVYKLTKHGSGWITTPLYQFGGAPDGSSPFARVTIGPDGAIYGTTQIGGTGSCTTYGAGCGTIFVLRPPATACSSAVCPWNETVLYSFDSDLVGGNGAYPTSEVVFDAAGNFYGTASQGGPGGGGVAYKMTKTANGYSYSVIHGFGASNDGWLIYGGLIMDASGNLYGVAYNGLASIFKLSPSGSGWTETILHTLAADGHQGQGPSGSLLMDQAGNLYGTTVAGGPRGSVGTAFMLTHTGGVWNFSVLTGLPCGRCSLQIGGSYGSLSMDSAGNLYGTTRGNGSFGMGSAFKLIPSGGSYSYTSLHDFTGGSDGGAPYSNLVMDNSGNLYGTTSGGGIAGGVVFEITQ